MPYWKKFSVKFRIVVTTNPNKVRQNKSRKKNAVQKRKQIGTKYGKTKIKKKCRTEEKTNRNKVRQNKSRKKNAVQKRKQIGTKYGKTKVKEKCRIVFFRHR